MLSHRTPPVHGAALIGDLVFKSLTERDFDVRYIGLSSSSAINEVGKLNFKKVKFLFVVLYTLIFELIFFKPNIVYITPSVSGSAFYKDFFFSIIIKIYRLIHNNYRLIFHIHMRPHRVSWFREKYLFKILFRSSEIIIPSIVLLKDYKKNILSKTKISILPYAIKPICEKKIAYKKALNYSPTSLNKKTLINVLYLGHLIESKGYRRALVIAKAVIKKNKMFKFNFVGECGSVRDLDYFDDFVLINNLKENIFFWGPCKDDKLKCKLFLKNDLLILPSYSEAYPLTILEAFSVGIPVIATDTGAIKEIISANFGSVVADKGNNIQYINNFTNDIMKITSLWNTNLALECIDRFYVRWCESRFISELIPIFNSKPNYIEN